MIHLCFRSLVNFDIATTSILIFAALGKDEFATAGSTFVTSFNAAIADMKGEAKDALEEFFNTNIRDLVSSEESGIPAMVMGFGDLIETNRSQFASIDHTIAESIKGGGQ
jgi:hypothetical protein